MLWEPLEAPASSSPVWREGLPWGQMGGMRMGQVSEAGGPLMGTAGPDVFVKVAVPTEDGWQVDEVVGQGGKGERCHNSGQEQWPDLRPGAMSGEEVTAWSA